MHLYLLYMLLFLLVTQKLHFAGLHACIVLVFKNRFKAFYGF